MMNIAYWPRPAVLHLQEALVGVGLVVGAAHGVVLGRTHARAARVLEARQAALQRYHEHVLAGIKRGVRYSISIIAPTLTSVGRAYKWYRIPWRPRYINCYVALRANVSVACPDRVSRSRTHYMPPINAHCIRWPVMFDAVSYRCQGTRKFQVTATIKIHTNLMALLAVFNNCCDLENIAET